MILLKRKVIFFCFLILPPGFIFSTKESDLGSGKFMSLKNKTLDTQIFLTNYPKLRTLHLNCCSLLNQNNSILEMTGNYLCKQRLISLSKETDYLMLISGIVSENILISKDKAAIIGSIKSAGSIILENSSAAVTFNQKEENENIEELGADLVGNGGTFVFNYNVCIPGISTLFGPGHLTSENNSSMFFGKKNQEVVSISPKSGNWLLSKFKNVVFEESFELFDKWTFKASEKGILINGNNQFIKLSKNGKLVFDSTDGKIIVKDLVLVNNLSGAKCIEVIGNNVFMDSSVQVSSNVFLYDDLFNPKKKKNIYVTKTREKALPTKKIGDFVKQERLTSVSSETKLMTVLQNFILEKNCQFIFEPNSSIVIDGQENLIEFQFNKINSKLFLIPNNCKLVFKNIKMKNFDPAAFDLDSTGSITFSDNCQLEISKSILLNSESILNIDGKVKIVGIKGKMIIDSFGLNILNNGNLALENIRLDIVSVDSIKMEPLGSLTLNNSYAKLPNKLILSSGSIKILNKVIFLKSKNYADEFEFLLDKNFSIKISANSKLEVLAGINLKFLTNRASIVFENNETSCLFLNGSCLSVLSGGLLIENGMLLIKNLVKIKTSNEGSLFFKNIAVKILDGAKLSVEGSLVSQDD